MQWQDGTQFLYLGNLITLRVFRSAKASIHFDSDMQELHLHFGLSVTPEQMPDLIRHRIKLWLQAKAKEIFLQRMPVYATSLNVRYQSLSLSNAGTRWGSCTSSGKIRLNWKLIHFSITIIDYVIAHELSHLLEMNHSPRFWTHVKSVFPHYQEARNHLRQQAHHLPTF